MPESETIRIYSGLPGTGKTSRLIDEMVDHTDAGGKVLLFLSSEHHHLTDRANVKPGGLMGCRVPGKSFRIDRVCTTDEATAELSTLEKNTLVVFDEAQYFGVRITDAWQRAAERGVQVRVASPSDGQLKALNGVNCILQKFETNCTCGREKATHAWHEDNKKAPIHLCQACYEQTFSRAVDELLLITQECEPFPGELHTYQPFFGVDMRNWSLVRGDSTARLDIILRAVEKTEVQDILTDANRQPSYLDLGCCSGFFCDGMTTTGFVSTGVDVTRHFIDWASRLATIKEQTIDYRQLDAHDFLRESEDSFDVTSTFATVQWVMAQKGYDKGLDCLKMLFEKTRHIAIVEMGYTSEDIYREKIPDRPREIDGEWVMDTMKQYGDFATVEFHPAGKNGIWRDVFVGIKQIPKVHHSDALPSLLRLKTMLKARAPRLFERLKKLKRAVKGQ